MDNFFSPSKVDCKCEKCSNTKATVTLTFESLPRILILHLKRFRPNFEKMTYEKRSDAVAIPDKLEILNYEWSCTRCTLKNAGDAQTCKVCNNPRGKNSCAYKLKAAVLHQGATAGAGHYVTHVYENEKLGWKRYNDSRVTNIGKFEALSKAKTQAYLLFFVADDCE